MEKKNYIIADCVCDLSKEYIARKGIGIVRFYLELDSGRFMDGYEISYANVIEHYQTLGKRIISTEPTAQEYADIYKSKLTEFESIIHFTISSGISQSYTVASEGRGLLGVDAGRVHIVDTETLSSGMSFMIIKAIEMNEEGKAADEILNVVKGMINKVSVSFISPDVENLVINERVPKNTASIFKSTRLHPVFGIDKGILSVAGVEVGARERYIRSYVKHRMKRRRNIDDERVFITHAACTLEEIDIIKSEIKKYMHFKNIHVCTTSATVACNCGAGAFGVIYMYK